MYRQIIYIFFIVCCFQLCDAQVSIMQEEAAYYHQLGLQADDYEALHAGNPQVYYPRSDCQLQKMVFGWHPYWSNGLQNNYRWNLLSDLSYFSYEVDAANGQALTTNGWNTAAVIDSALANGVRVNLCVTLFSDHATFFTNANAQSTLINNLITLVQSRGANGVNIDIEGLPSGQSLAFNNFMVNLCNAFHTADPNYQVSLCLYAVDWSNVFDEALLATVVDYFTIMGYDYYYTGSAEAGPVDPLYGFSNSYDRSLSRSVSYYTRAGIPLQKLILGLPYYGREWETISNAVPSNTTGNNVFARTYAFVKNNTSGNYSNPQFNLRSNSNVFIFQSNGTWRQCWTDLDNTYSDRYEFVKLRSLAGIGIWALGYDNGYANLWQAIENELSDCAIIACSDTIYDGGGPLVDYYDHEDYTFTIAPPGASQVNLQFSNFITEAGFDTLWIFDGNTINAPLVGAYEGNNSPGNITSTAGSITLRFKSDGATRDSGWEMSYECVQDTTPQLNVAGQTNGQAIHCYPNPASDLISIQLSQPVDKLQLVDAGGRIVKVTENPATSFIWDIRHFAPGLYVLKGGSFQYKFIIVK